MSFLSSGPWVAEVHPALALWLWCRKGNQKRVWAYKDDWQALKRLWKRLCQELETLGVGDDLLTRLVDPNDDDDLDSLVAWLLGELWARGAVGRDKRRLVVMVGSRRVGAMLLPNVPGLVEGFNSYMKRSQEGR